MSPTLVVAGREFRQLTRLPSFWITLVFVPFALLASALAGEHGAAYSGPLPTAGMVLPIGIDYLLLLIVGLSGSWLLQSMVEERSNKLLEAILACASPSELMHGKLIGTGAAGLTIVVIWLGVAAFIGKAHPDLMAEPLAASTSFARPLLILALVFYFLTGFLGTSTIFLALGATSESMRDVQGYLLPIIMLLIVPVVALLDSMLTNPHGVLPVIMSWIPFYTPFAMLARLAIGVTLREVIGTSALLICFLTVELVALGRVFRASLLRTGQPPRLGAMLRMMLSRDQ